MSIARYEPPRASLATDDHYTSRLGHLASRLAHSSLCPETWRVKPSDPPAVADQKVADLEIIGLALADIDLRLSLSVLPQCYVVHGRPGYMAQLQIALAERFGCRIVPLSATDKEAVVRVLGKDGEWHDVPFTMAEAVKAGWPSKNPNYKSMPDRMLMARAVTKAISWHCPEAKMMLPPADRDELPGTTAPEVPAAPSTSQPAAATQRERARVRRLLDELTPEVAGKVREAWLVEELPPLGRETFTSADAERAEDLIWRVVDALRAEDTVDGEVVDDNDGDPFADEPTFDAEEVPGADD